MRQVTLPTMLVLGSMFALTGCGTTGPAGVEGLRRVVGADLIGARGATPADQRKIDRTVVGLCAGKIWSRAECAAHGDSKKIERGGGTNDGRD
ncbi:hypothetical protein [Rhizobium sp. CSW-27]|uniref:hypothetical protein n=1 Tax=Rhizobium sp. CSW-27 TaxID=2839985 RepID=UPI001C015DAA|nr:hypothetical protein [Rhizobium sp. CSW-27]MBT9373173.1 hypothetical protein [Rhizobium sp. CSW-27]